MPDNDNLDMYDEIFDMDDFVTLVDDEGNEEDYILVDVIDYNSKTYAVFIPAGDEEQPFVILEYVEQPDSDEGTYLGVDDDDTVDRVYNIFLKRIEELDGE